jgi:membrane protease YdiL (CAAX protease family)
MSTLSRQFFIKLAVIVTIWYLCLVYLPQLVGTCLDGNCGFTGGEIVLSLAIPLAIIALSALLDVPLYGKTPVQALRDTGLTRFSWTGIRSAALYLLPLLAFYPLFSLLTNTPLAAQPNWQWLLLNVILINGLAEEIMMRGFVFRHLREGRTFWRAAVIAMLYFAAYHIVLIFTAGPLIGIIAVIIAIPAGLLTAYVYERGDNTVWGPGLFHAVYNAPALLLVFPADMQPAANSLYLLLGIVVSTLVLVRAYRAGYGRGEAAAMR